MTVGLSITQADINQRAAALAIGLRDSLEACRRFHAFLNDATIIPNDTFLTNLGFSSAEVTTLRAAFAAAKKLSDIANSLDTQTPASNFLVDIKKLCGTVV
jgi:hypothetical protein